jgi:hypothetical protein
MPTPDPGFRSWQQQRQLREDAMRRDFNLPEPTSAGAYGDLLSATQDAQDALDIVDLHASIADAVDHWTTEVWPSMRNEARMIYRAWLLA